MSGRLKLRKICYKPLVLLLLCAIRLYGQELWGIYKIQELKGNDSIVREYESADKYVFIDNNILALYEKTLTAYEGGMWCFKKYTYEIDSIKKDSIFSSSYTADIALMVFSESKSLYFSGDDLVAHIIRTFDIRDTSNVKAYFKKVDLSLEKEINLKVCATNINTSVIRKKEPGGVQSLFNLLGQQLNLQSTRKPQAVHLNKSKKLIDLKR